MCLAGTVETVHDHAHDPRPPARPAVEDRAIDPLEEPGPVAPPAGRRGLLDRRAFLRTAALVGAGAAASAVLPAAVAGAPPGFRGRRTRDLTHVFRAGFPVYGLGNPARETLVTIENDGFYMQRWTFPEHSGTHVDAPGHFTIGGRFADELDPDDLLAPIVVVDIAARAATDPDAEVTPADLRAFERRHGRIPRGALVAMYSGWEARVGDEDAYRNTAPDGSFHFPGFGLDAVEWLLERRAISAIGVDTLSLDNGPSTTFAVHVRLLGEDRYGVENLRNLAKIPARGATAFVGLIPWEAGSGGPCRVVAQW